MIHAYREQYSEIIQNKLAEMFELAVLNEKLDIDAFANLFAGSNIGKAFESMDPVFVLGKSSNELLSLIIDKPPVDIYIAEYASPEYWVGWVLGFAQTSLNKSYRTLFKVFPCGELINYYFPYHEMDITKIIDVFKERLAKYSPLKEARERIGLSQNDLSLITDVPIRNIRAYEQNKLDIRKAQADTVLSLARALNCSIDYLIY